LPFSTVGRAVVGNGDGSPVGTEVGSGEGAIVGEAVG